MTQAEYPVSITGHRSLRRDQIDVAAPQLAAAFHALNQATQDKDQQLVIISGFADGADQLAAMLALKMNIPVHAYIPHPQYAQYYYDRGVLNINVFNDLLAQASYVLYTSTDGDFHYKMNFIRNRCMVEDSEMVIAVTHLNKDPHNPDTAYPKPYHKGGTAHAIREAQRVKREILYVHIPR